MPNDVMVITTIIAMAIATYMTRAGGLWLLERMTPSPFVTACLSHLPGTLLIAIVAPLMLEGGPAEWVGGGATILTMARTDNLLLALIAGVGAVWAIRMVM